MAILMILLLAAQVDDMTPPADTADLGVSIVGGVVTLAWTGAGDDGMNGTPNGYWVVACKDASFIDPFGAGTPLEFPADPTPAARLAGTGLSMEITGLPAGTLYYFSVGTNDENGNSSGHSNLVSITTPLPADAIPSESIDAGSEGSRAGEGFGSCSAFTAATGGAWAWGALLLPFMNRRNPARRPFVWWRIHAGL